MINHKDKGKGLAKAIAKAGHWLRVDDNVIITSDAAAVQLIIDNYNPLPEAQAEAKTKVKEASAIKRLEFVTQAAGKDAEYTFKAQEAIAYDIDGTIGVYMQGRMDATADSAATVAAEWNINALAWKQVGAYLAGLEDKANKLINAETDWQQCTAIAASIVDEIKAI